MEDRRQDDKTLAVFIQKFSDFLASTEKYREKQEKAQDLLFEKLGILNEAVLKLPCEGRRLVYLENKSWVDKNLVALWCVAGTVSVALLAEWIKLIK